MKIKYCKNCIIPETRPNTEIDTNGLCSGCTYYFNRDQIDFWGVNMRIQPLQAIVALNQLNKLTYVRYLNGSLN